MCLIIIIITKLFPFQVWNKSSFIVTTSVLLAKGVQEHIRVLSLQRVEEASHGEQSVDTCWRDQSLRTERRYVLKRPVIENGCIIECNEMRSPVSIIYSLWKCWLKGSRELKLVSRKQALYTVPIVQASYKTIKLKINTETEVLSEFCHKVSK